jgi:hypothetical protein
MRSRTEFGQQRKPLPAQFIVFGVDHHLVEKPVDRGTQLGKRSHRLFKMFRLYGFANRIFRILQRNGQRSFFRLACNRVTHMIERSAIFLSDLQNIRRALVSGEQVLPLVGGDKPLQRLDPRKKPDEIILTAKREHGVDQVVADAGFTLLDFEAVGEEGNDVVCVSKELLQSLD